VVRYVGKYMSLGWSVNLGGQEIWEVGGLGGQKNPHDNLFGKKCIFESLCRLRKLNR
jgi:hypothetical protein